MLIRISISLYLFSDPLLFIASPHPLILHYPGTPPSALSPSPPPRSHPTNPDTTPTPTPTPVPGTTYDNRLRESTPNDVLNNDYYVDIGQIPGFSRYRDVFWFDLSVYNATDRVTQAKRSLFWFYPSSIRNQNTILEVYRSLPWDQAYVNWNNRTYNTPWNNPGGDWFDRNNAAQGNVPFASVMFGASDLPDNRYYDLDVTELVQGYVNGTYNNTGFFLKAKDENDNYIAFYSSDWSNASQRPKLTISYTTGGTPSNPVSSITSFSPGNLTPSYAVNSITSFSVTTDQAVSSTWYLNGVNQNNNAQTWPHTWDTLGQYNMTYVGANGNGSVSITWNVSVITSSPYDVNQDGYVDQADLDVIALHFGEVTVAPYPRYDVNTDGIVDVYDVIAVATNI